MPASTSPPPPHRRYHFGSPAVVYIVVTLLLALGAFNSQNNLLFWAFGFSLATLVVSGVLSGAMLMGIDVRRERIDDAEAGGTLAIRYRVRNRNRLIPAFALTIEELPATSAAVPNTKTRVPPTITRIDQPRAFVAHIGPREQLVATCTVSARKRGRVAFRAFVVHTSFPFGLVRKSLLFSEPAGAVIRPAPLAMETALIDRALSIGDADRPGRLRGPGDEFHSLREYSPGDSPGAIAWKASARRGVLLVRQALAPAPTRVWVVLRLGVSDAADDVLDERAIGMAASAVHHAMKLDLAVGLAVPRVRVQVPPRALPGQATRLLHELGLIELDGQSGRSEPFPRLTRGGAGEVFICIHAGPIDPAFAPSAVIGGGDPRSARRVVHLSAAPVAPVAPAPPKRVSALVAPSPVEVPA